MNIINEYYVMGLFKNIGADRPRPRNKKELINIILDTINIDGFNCDLNHIDTSLIDDMSFLFNTNIILKSFNGDISQWDVSNVTNMNGMFLYSEFNGDISQWDVSNVMDMANMFNGSKFNRDISQWDVSGVMDMSNMFERSKFMKDISDWKLSKSTRVNSMFYTYDERIFPKRLMPKIMQSSISRRNLALYGHDWFSKK